MIERLRAARLRARHGAALARFRPRSAWHSWEPDPAGHPWLSRENLVAARAHSEAAWAQAEQATREIDPHAYRYGFVCNLANYLYQRAVPLRRHGYDVEVVLHPYDKFVMSQPGWEEFDGELDAAPSDVADLAATGVVLPSVPGVVQLPVSEQQLHVADGIATDPAEIAALVAQYPYLRFRDVARYPLYLCHLPTFEHLQDHDALLSSQGPYLAYLSGRPYLTAQNGGDLWLDCSRNDAHGHLHRLAFGNANALLASNPWTFGHARRYGMTNSIYLPFMLDDEAFSPGESPERRDWEERTGGTFFVLSTARLDDRYKGSRLALDGFRAFAEREPGARLVQLAWGADLEGHLARLREWGLADRVLVLPLAGKRRLIRYLRAADVLLDQFSLGAYGATALEAMGCGLPVVMRLELEQYDALVPAGAPPVLQAATPGEVARRLEEAASGERRHELGDAARAWFLAAHGSSRWVDLYGRILAATASGHIVDHSRSPLVGRRSDEELEYERRGLEAAPPFPAAG